MKQKTVTFIIGFLFYGTTFGLLMYFVEKNITVKQALFQGLFFGVLMGLFEVFLNPKIKSYFNKRNSKKAKQ